MPHVAQQRGVEQIETREIAAIYPLSRCLSLSLSLSLSVSLLSVVCLSHPLPVDSTVAVLACKSCLPRLICLDFLPICPTRPRSVHFPSRVFNFHFDLQAASFVYVKRKLLFVNLHDLLLAPVASWRGHVRYSIVRHLIKDDCECECEYILLESPQCIAL